MLLSAENIQKGYGDRVILHDVSFYLERGDKVGVVGVNRLRTGNNATIVITHYQRLLDYIRPDVVHVLYKGRIVKTAGPELALELEERGYDWIKEEVDGGGK